ncbi:3'(2'),5'-bisphosphate nucleotidase CysQ [Aequorivita lipolytica]|uniref:3'(2'),5'-bisphosphate nucleotidase CysQ n=1 Tax=Aequorivita lipolytica TaxID=153267 RepID=A0A5C6YQ61_9FLAO|nr:3'(2'),5'-bisphosphate nucleotidase CysQ [Aequorivita lipolytica]TXD69690.1 3'(2'),5'-bisphosphate nucleotidase CysQ [Aequorivita lipolytica]SRX51187.1 3'(2'),5'-bisphosphate nucleotidase CysQ [Aequorivita lipolytica]
MKNNLSVAIQAALDAGKEILKIYGTDFSVEIKGDDSPLTQADENANAVIMGYLKATGIPIISEENKQLDFSERKDWSRCWIVDPLDGTKEFIKRNGEFTVNIALVEDGNPILGVIYVPVSKELYFTSEDGKTSKKIIVPSEEISLQEIFEKAEPIKPSAITSKVQIVGSRSHLNEETKDFISEIEKQREVEIVSKGSSLKFCLVAEGLAHIYPRYAPTMEWDTAAGHAICKAVGVSVIDQTTKMPMRYNKPNLLNNHFLVQV